jgi:hypothetical protein
MVEQVDSSRGLLSKRKTDGVDVWAGTAYEDQLGADSRWALSEGSLFFEGKGAVQTALKNIALRLDELGIPYAVAGGLALFHHGFRRFTEDVDILVTKEDLRKIHTELEGRGYLPPFHRSKNLRDTDLGVRIEFLVSGGYPGDGKLKPVAFPDPRDVFVRDADINYLNLPSLVELKLASGMTNAERMKDLSDVQELIKVLQLPAGFVDSLNPYVQEKFREIWNAVRGVTKRYVMTWRNKFLTVDATSLEEMATLVQEAAETLKAMVADGVVLDPDGGTNNDYAVLVTADPDIAQKYGMQDESEMIEDEPEDDSEQPNDE